MSENFSLDIFKCEEITTLCTVPIFWTDESVWDDSEVWTEGAKVRGIFYSDYNQINLGIAGQDNESPMVRFLTSDIPYAKEGVRIYIGEKEYQVGTPRKNSFGITEIDLFYAPKLTDSSEIVY